jgi:tetratricopeptide (TPR) repeat protein
MAAIGYSDKFIRLGREYLLQTSVNELRRCIISSLFHSGQLINSRIFSLLENTVANSVESRVAEIHQRSLADINTLLGLIERMQDLDKPELIEKLGRTLCARDMFDEGLELMTGAVEKYPDLPGIHNVMGRLYLARSIFDKAVEELSRAADLAPIYPDYRNILGVAYLKADKPVAAISEFKKAVELNIYYHEAFFNLGLAHLLNGVVKEDFNIAKDLQAHCLDAFGKATLFNPGYLNEDYERGISLLKEDNFKDAYDILSHVASVAGALSPGDKLLEMFLQYIHGERGMTESGIAEYIGEISELLKANPGHADLHNELGMAYFILSKIINKKAIFHYNEALRINPNFIKAARNLKLSENDLKGFEVLLEAIVR